MPFYDRWGTIPNERGRILTKHEGREVLTGNYVVGWIKRGPSGIIGTNKPDAIETAERFLEDLESGEVLQPRDTRAESIIELARMRKAELRFFCRVEDPGCDRIAARRR